MKKFTSIFILMVYLYTNCNYFSISNLGIPEVTVHNVPVLGDLGIVFLDNEYNQTAEDIGKLGLYIENNELTKDVLVIAEIEEDDSNNQVIVHVANMQNDSLVSFYYYFGQRFPYKMLIKIDDDEVIGKFSIYNTNTETFSIDFYDKERDSERIENLVLDKNIFYLFDDNNELSETQYMRVRNIYTTLGIWENLAIQIDETEKEDNANARALFKKPSLKKIIVGTLVTVAVVAVAVAVIATSPVIVAVAVTTAVTFAAAAIITEIFMPDDFMEKKQILLL